MSFQTTMARAAARDADEVYQRHRKFCVLCQPAARRRRWDQLCAEGAGMRQLKLDLQKAAEHGAWLDKQPSPDQAALFSIEEIKQAGS
jgi:hypothetical protein